MNTGTVHTIVDVKLNDDAPLVEDPIQIDTGKQRQLKTRFAHVRGKRQKHRSLVITQLDITYGPFALDRRRNDNVTPTSVIRACTICRYGKLKADRTR